MSIKIQGAEYPMEKVFSDDFAFTIPRYQRPYSWTEEQASELLADLVDAYNRSGSQEPYFLGSVVLIKEAGKSASQVIDGQQRLTTLTILLAAMRDTLKDLGDKEVYRDIHKKIFQVGSKLTKQKDQPRMQIHEHSNGFFREYIQNDVRTEFSESQKITDPQKNLIGNYLYFRKELKIFSEEDLSEMAGFILLNCFVIIVSTPSLESAYRIFSVMNDRGMDLSHTDILKAEIIGEISETNRENYADLWEEIEENLGRKQFENLFSHIRMAYRKAKLQDTILKEIRPFIKDKTPEGFISELTDYATAYSMLRNKEYGEDKKDQKVNHLLRWLDRIPNDDWIPPALHYLIKTKRNTDKDYIFFAKLERLAASLMITKADVNGRIRRYSEILKSLDGGEDSTLVMELSNDEKLLVGYQLSTDVYNHKKAIQYILLRLDAALSDAGAEYDYPVISVEHVLPQNPKPGSKWIAIFPNERRRAELTHILGNLTLLSRAKNSSASNQEFDTKKKKYFTGKHGTSPFVLTTQVLQEKIWDEKVIQRRQTEALETLKKVWDLTSVISGPSGAWMKGQAPSQRIRPVRIATGS